MIANFASSMPSPPPLTQPKMVSHLPKTSSRMAVGPAGGARGHHPPVTHVSVSVLFFLLMTTIVDIHRRCHCRPPQPVSIDEQQCHLLLLLLRRCGGGVQLCRKLSDVNLSQETWIMILSLCSLDPHRHRRPCELDENAHKS
jgi:hypothetical protein